MKKKEKIMIITLFIAAIILSSSISIFATTCIFNSVDVSYDNSNSGLTSTNVQASLDELYGHCTDYTAIDQRLTSVENSLISIDDIYPVGSIYITITEDTAAKVQAKFGGTWEAFGQGRTLIGAGTGTDSNSTSQTFTVNSTGGEYSHKLTSAESGVRAHSHTYDKVNSTTESHTLTISEIPSHNHTAQSFTQITTAMVPAGSGYYYGKFEGSVTTSKTGGGGGHSHSIKTTSTYTGTHAGADAANNHNNIQPYITVYMYKRTA